MQTARPLQIGLPRSVHRFRRFNQQSPTSQTEPTSICQSTGICDPQSGLPNRRLKFKFNSWIYFIQAENSPYLVKIGRTLRPPKYRLEALKTSSPVSLRTVLILRSFPQLETLLHLAFTPWRQHGEWFRPSFEIGRFITHCRGYKNNYLGPSMVNQWLTPMAAVHNPDMAAVLANDLNKCHDLLILWKPRYADAPIEISAEPMVVSTQHGVLSPEQNYSKPA